MAQRAPRLRSLASSLFIRSEAAAGQADGRPEVGPFVGGGGVQVRHGLGEDGVLVEVCGRSRLPNRVKVRVK